MECAVAFRHLAEDHHHHMYNANAHAYINHCIRVLYSACRTSDVENVSWHMHSRSGDLWGSWHGEGSAAPDARLHSTSYNSQ